MKLSEMFEAFTHEDAKTLNDVKISRYMPIATKVDIINSCDKKFAAAELDISNTTAIAKMKELAKFFDLLLAYVDIEVDDRSEKIGFKIRSAQLEKVPYMLLAGDKDIENNTVSLRTRSGGDKGAMSLDEFVEKIVAEVESKSLELTM